MIWNRSIIYLSGTNSFGKEEVVLGVCRQFLLFFFFSEEVRTNKLYTHEKLFGDMEQMFFVCLERTSVCLEHSLLEI
jgi:hypothetical protein